MTVTATLSIVEWTFCLGAIQPPLVTERKHNCSLECAYLGRDLFFSHVLCSGRHDAQRAITCNSTNDCISYHNQSTCHPVFCGCKSHMASISAPFNQTILRPKTSITICTVNLKSPKIEVGYPESQETSSKQGDERRNFPVWSKAWQFPIQPVLFLFGVLSLILVGGLGIKYARKKAMKINVFGFTLGVPNDCDDATTTSNYDARGAMLNDYPLPETHCVDRHPEQVPLALILNDQPPPYEVALQIGTRPKYLNEVIENHAT